VVEFRMPGHGLDGADHVLDVGNLVHGCEELHIVAPMALLDHSRHRFDHRTKTEHRATILLPNPVAARGSARDKTDGYAKTLK
jgi:hypothetical protein